MSDPSLLCNVWIFFALNIKRTQCSLQFISTHSEEVIMNVLHLRTVGNKLASCTATLTRTPNFGPRAVPFKPVRGSPGAVHSSRSWWGSFPVTIHSYTRISRHLTGYTKARRFLTPTELLWLRLSNVWNMFTVSELVVLLAVLSATASGYFVSIDAHAEECFYERVNSGTKMGLMFEVAEGGFLDIDVEVK